MNVCTLGNIIIPFNLPQSKKGPRPLEKGVQDILDKAPEMLYEMGKQEFLWIVSRQHSVSGLFDIDDKAQQAIPSEFKEAVFTNIACILSYNFIIVISHNEIGYITTSSYISDKDSFSL